MTMRNWAGLVIIGCVVLIGAILQIAWGLLFTVPQVMVPNVERHPDGTVSWAFIAALDPKWPFYVFIVAGIVGFYLLVTRGRKRIHN